MQSTSRDLRTSSEAEGDGDDDGVTETSSHSIAFEVLLVQDAGNGSGAATSGSSSASARDALSPWSRVAVFVENYAQGSGRTDLAESIGVSPDDIR